MRKDYDRLADNIKAIGNFLEALRVYRDLSRCEHPDVIEEAETGLAVDYAERLVEIDDLKMQVEQLEKENKQLREEIVKKVFVSLGWDFLGDEDDDDDE